jgi:hypothetical protein
MSIMLPQPGLPLHLQAGAASKQSAHASLPFSRSCWSILPTRVFKTDFVFPFLGVRGRSGGAASHGGTEEKKAAGQFVVQEVFASSPLIEHGVAAGDV